MPDSDGSGCVKATLGLGGNVGDPRATMSEALCELQRLPEIGILAVSRLYRTPPWGPVKQDWFLNCCVLVETSLGPHQLLENILVVESRFKRVRTIRWGPRTIDIDILTYRNCTLETLNLTIPHPRMLSRAFVMLPLSEIAGGFMVKGRKVSDWADACDATGIENASKDGDWWFGGAG